MHTSTIVNGKRNETAQPENPMVVGVVIDDSSHAAHPGEWLVDLINRVGVKLAQVCYLPQLGPIQTCNTCLVEINGQLVRACATTVSEGMNVSTTSSRAHAAQQEAFDRILSNHMLYCTVCDNNNGNCTVHNTTKLLAIEHQHIPFQNKPILGETLGEIDPDLFDGFALALPEAMREAKAQGKEPPSFLVILNKFRSKDLRRGLVAVNSLLEAWGKDFFSEARSEPKE